MARDKRPARGQGIEGVLSLLLTPFRSDKSIDWKAYDSYIDWQLAFAPSGLFAVCGSSEMKWLTLDERVELARRAAFRSGEIPVFATANLEDDCALHAEEIKRIVDTGVTGVVLTPHASVSGDPAAYTEYLLTLIDAADCPVILYEWPLVENYIMSPETFMVLAPHVAGIKDTTCTIDGIGSKIAVAGDSIVYQANMPLMLDAFELGARGVMSVTSTCCASLVIRLWETYKSRSDDAQCIHRELVLLDSVMRSSYPMSAKYLAARQGVNISPCTRWPVQMDVETIKAIDVWYQAHDWNH